jgi:hypothetical protein
VAAEAPLIAVDAGFVTFLGVEIAPDECQTGGGAGFVGASEALPERVRWKRSGRTVHQ